MESTPFIEDERAYSKSNEAEFQDDLNYRHPPQTQSQGFRRRLLPLVGSFFIGLFTAAFLFGIWTALLPTRDHPSSGAGQSLFRPLPAAREGKDEVTGLPLSWSNGDCGNSPEDALARGCRYSIVLHSWLPQDCLAEEDIEDEGLMHTDREWPFKLDNGTDLTIESLHGGDYGHFTTSFDWHVTHCMFVWKRLHRVMMDKEQRLDSYTANFHHTNHCVEMIGGHPEGMKDSGTKIFVKYPVCA